MIDNMNDAAKLKLEAQMLTNFISKGISAWNKQLKAGGHLVRYTFTIDFYDASEASSKSDSQLKIEVPTIIGKTHLETGAVILESYKTTIPSQKKKLFTYTHTFAPSNFLEGMKDVDYNNCTILLLQNLLVEMTGTFLQTLNHLVK